MTTAEVVLPLTLRGGNLLLYNSRDPEILAEGPAGTGKTRTCLELLNDLCREFAGLQVLMTRKVQATMPQSCIKEMRLHVLHSGDGVQWFGGSKAEPAAFRYSNGSSITVAGMDNPEKALSSFYDLIYWNEATEATKDDWEILTTRLRGSDAGHNPMSKDGREFRSRRIIGDANPTYASHWLMQRTDLGQTRLIRSKLEDNPAYYDDDGKPTEAGLDYISKLDRLTGIRYERFRLGKRVGVENACYPMFSREIHVRPLEPGLLFKETIIGEDYGSDHLCAVAAVSIDQFNRRWVREVWAGADEREDPGKPSRMDLVVAQFKEKYKAKRGRVDPNQAKLASLHGFNIAKGGSGGRQGPPRLKRIDDMEQLFYVYEGGRVPTSRDVKNLIQQQGPFMEPDTPGIFLVEGMPGIDELADEIEAYHYVYSETPRGKTKDVFRQDDDRIASVEYANEEWVEGSAAPVFTRAEFEKRPAQTAQRGFKGLN